MTFPPPHRAFAEARRWYVRLQDVELPQAERRAFAGWLRAYPENRLAWVEVAGQLEELDRDLSGAAPLLKQRYPLAMAVAGIARDRSISASSICRTNLASRRGLLRMAAATGTLMLGGGLLMRAASRWDDVSSGRGERRQID